MTVTVYKAFRVGIDYGTCLRGRLLSVVESVSRIVYKPGRDYTVYAPYGPSLDSSKAYFCPHGFNWGYEDRLKRPLFAFADERAALSMSRADVVAAFEVNPDAVVDASISFQWMEVLATSFEAHRVVLSALTIPPVVILRRCPGSRMDAGFMRALLDEAQPGAFCLSG